MELSKLIKNSAQISITVSADDLMAWGEELIKQAIAAARVEEANRIRAIQAERLITEEEACNIFEVSKQTLWRWRKKGYITGVSVGGRIKYHEAECRRILENLV